MNMEAYITYISRVYLNGGRMDLGTIGDGDLGAAYRRRWVGYLLGGAPYRA